MDGQLIIEEGIQIEFINLSFFANSLRTKTFITALGSNFFYLYVKIFLFILSFFFYSISLLEMHFPDFLSKR